MRRKTLGLGFRKNKKANVIADTAMVIILLIAFALITYFSTYVFNDLNDDIQADADMDATAQAMVQTQHDNFHGLFDGLFMLFFVLMWCLVLVASYTTDTKPIFIIFTLVLMIFVFIATVYMGNSYEEIANDDALADDVVPLYPMAHHVLTHLLIYAICIGLSAVGVMFAKNYYGQQ
jgi:glucan phosphoethanolaminetransferase (alkaline phosphatase superfamily)